MCALYITGISRKGREEREEKYKSHSHAEYFAISPR